jgi:putative transcriptional regulator
MMKKKVKSKFFDDLREAVADAIAYERGENLNLRVTSLPGKPRPIRPLEIRQLREKLNASQPLFAKYLGVSAKAVQSWEQGTRRPRNSALRLLLIAKKQPKVLLIA